MYIKTDNRGHESFETGFQSDVLRNVVDLWENTPDEDFAQVLGHNLFEDIYDTAESIQEQNAIATAEYHDIPVEVGVRKYALDEIPIKGYRSPEGAARLYGRAAYEMSALAYEIDPFNSPEPDKRMLEVCQSEVVGRGPDQLPRAERCLDSVITVDEKASLTIDAMRSGDFDQIAASQIAHGVSTPLVSEIAAAQPTVEMAHEKLVGLVTSADKIAQKPPATDLNKYRRVANLIEPTPMPFDDAVRFDGADPVRLEPLHEFAGKQVNQAQKKTSLLKTHAAHDPQAESDIDLGF